MRHSHIGFNQGVFAPPVQVSRSTFNVLLGLRFDGDSKTHSCLPRLIPQLSSSLGTVLLHRTSTGRIDYPLAFSLQTAEMLFSYDR
jgi:hypothetical protein